MGQDMYHYSREVAIQSHGSVMAALQKARDQLRADGYAIDHDLIKEIDQALANGRIT